MWLLACKAPSSSTICGTFKRRGKRSTVGGGRLSWSPAPFESPNRWQRRSSFAPNHPWPTSTTRVWEFPLAASRTCQCALDRSRRQCSTPLSVVAASSPSSARAVQREKRFHISTMRSRVPQLAARCTDGGKTNHLKHRQGLRRVPVRLSTGWAHLLNGPTELVACGRR